MSLPTRVLSSHLRVRKPRRRVPSPRPEDCGLTSGMRVAPLLGKEGAHPPRR